MQIGINEEKYDTNIATFCIPYDYDILNYS